MNHETHPHGSAHAQTRRRGTLPWAGGALMLLGACGQPLDVDLRGLNGGFSTAQASQVRTAERPAPDSRGVITYPNYQVAVARQDDTVNTIAARVGTDAAALARYNGIQSNAPLRKGEVLALPTRVASATAPVPASAANSGGVDISTLAGNAINRSPASPTVQTAALPPASAAPAAAPQAPAPNAPAAAEPIRHRVERGETAYTISRLYQVPVKSLAEWNGLGPEFSIREGQYLLIPVARQAAPRSSAAPSAVVTAPGVGSPTPTPPSATKPLPKNEPPAPVAAPKPAAPVADVGAATTSSASSARMVYPVTGSIVREYAKGKNEGINIQSAPGTPVKAADAGTVAAITQSADGVPIVVVRHDASLLTVYANVTDVSVKKGDRVQRGQALAKLRGGSDSYVHFEVRNGFDSVDPVPYLK
ncbi:peptidoglycan DD-metalloendopeptidase family protein [Sulfitobacter sabulilitoris]|uniref:LysM peptidoglycan-binding domain-containing protein n=1 Tax=Sulfitobacter sabulilitoris TaxID=2562655 RepID=A0A5S3PKK5_9RHOB|nr:LysM peptidoglycan-binding domain-containing protein [Sulfitobacter sabulilitoris]